MTDSDSSLWPITVCALKMRLLSWTELSQSSVPRLGASVARRVGRHTPVCCPRPRPCGGRPQAAGGRASRGPAGCRNSPSTCARRSAPSTACTDRHTSSHTASRTARYNVAMYRLLFLKTHERNSASVGVFNLY